MNTGKTTKMSWFLTGSVEISVEMYRTKVVKGMNSCLEIGFWDV